MRPRHYELSEPADQDLEEIFDYTASEFGLEQAIDYLSGLEAVFDQLISNPELGRSRNEIMFELRSIAKASHVVFYRVLEDHIKIVRVLHGNRDVPRNLK